VTGSNSEQKNTMNGSGLVRPCFVRLEMIR
jgi:hypothetical protein